MLAGGINLARDVRNGRNFEYYGEDPLSQRRASAPRPSTASRASRSSRPSSTSRLNNNETNRHWLDAVVDPDAHRESDLLAFQIAIERSQPGSIMTSYNQVNGEYASGNGYLLNEVLKGAWGYKGWVMSDWGATPDWDFALKGLDQESGVAGRRHAVGCRSRSPRRCAKPMPDGQFPKGASPTWCVASCGRPTRSASTNGGQRPRWTWPAQRNRARELRARESCC